MENSRQKQVASSWISGRGRRKAWLSPAIGGLVPLTMLGLFATPFNNCVALKKLENIFGTPCCWSICYEIAHRGGISVTEMSKFCRSPLLRASVPARLSVTSVFLSFPVLSPACKYYYSLVLRTVCGTSDVLGKHPSTYCHVLVPSSLAEAWAIDSWEWVWIQHYRHPLSAGITVWQGWSPELCAW